MGKGGHSGSGGGKSGGWSQSDASRVQSYCDTHPGSASAERGLGSIAQSSAAQNSQQSSSQ